ncbi:MAG: putative ABC-class ATPase [Myxococcota bacterium]|jgi:predicted ABC-class ATPase
MPDADRLRLLLQRIDGRSYPAYRDLKGSWQLGEQTLVVDHVQGDPFAAPSRLRICTQTDIPADIVSDPDARAAAEDWLLRRFGASLHGRSRGSGRSGELRVYRPGPEIVERSALRLRPDGIAEVRLRAGLPARGRSVLGREAWALLTEDIPNAARTLRVGDHAELRAHVASVQRQRGLRRQLAERRLVAFIADGAILPRASGISQAPLEDAEPFIAPDSLRVSLDGPDGPINGLGVPEGLTLIVGGGFHGKSTLLQAIQRGIFDHVPGDGRERVVSRRDVVKVRAEDGRRVEGVDISPFLRDLPGGRGTAPFSTDDASGSTSQAAAIIEAVESGAVALLLDEDTSATNLLVRDARMRQLIPRENEPITPFVERVGELYRRWGVSTVMVVGGVGDYLAVSQTVIGMSAYVPQDLTEQAHALAGPMPSPPEPLGERPAGRQVDVGSMRPTGKGRVRARDERRVDYGDEEIDLMAVEQVLDGAHAATIGHALGWLAATQRGEQGLDVLLDTLEAAMDAEGVEVLSPSREPQGELVRPRRHEVAAALSRLRTARVGCDRDS